MRDSKKLENYPCFSATWMELPSWRCYEVMTCRTLSRWIQRSRTTSEVAHSVLPHNELLQWPRPPGHWILEHANWFHRHAVVECTPMMLYYLVISICAPRGYTRITEYGNRSLESGVVCSS